MTNSAPYYIQASREKNTGNAFPLSDTCRKSGVLCRICCRAEQIVHFTQFSVLL